MCLTLATVLNGCSENEKSIVPDVTGEFDVTILKTGKSDAIVLKTQNHSVIIDCGEKGDGDKIVEYCEENNISKADYIFVTHFDKDHVGGFPEVIESIDAENIIVPDYEGSNGEYKKYLKAVEKNGIKPTAITEDMYFILDDVLFEISPPKKQSYEEEDNDFSIVVSATHGENRFLFAGDAEEERLAEVMSELEGEYDFLKVPHHGRYNENTEKFIKSVNPEYAVICANEKNPPDEKTLSALENAGSEIYITKDGTVFAASDGKKIEIIQ